MGIEDFAPRSWNFIFGAKCITPQIRWFDIFGAKCIRGPCAAPCLRGICGTQCMRVHYGAWSLGSLQLMRFSSAHLFVRTFCLYAVGQFVFIMELYKVATQGYYGFCGFSFAGKCSENTLKTHKQCMENTWNMYGKCITNAWKIHDKSSHPH